MYPINAASPERIAIGAVIDIATGAVQTSGCTVTVRGQGGAEAGSAGTIAYGATGIVYYTPTQAETNFTSFVLIASKASCIPVCVTVVTTASAVAGYAGLDWGVMTQKTASNALTNTTIATTQKVDVETIKTQAVAISGAGTVTFPNATVASTTNITAGTITTVTNLTNAPTSGDLTAVMKASVTTAATAATPTAAAVTAGVTVTTNNDKTGYALTAVTGLGNQTANITGNLSGSVNSVTSNVNADVVKLNGDATAAAMLAVLNGTTVVYSGTVSGATTTTTLIDSSLTQADTDWWKGRIIIFKSAPLTLQATDITAFDPATDKLTFTATTVAPTAGPGGTTYVII